jgi:NitT/TauT family transport system ATP-binding protein
MTDTDKKLRSQDAFFLSDRCPMISTDEIAGLVHTIARGGAEGQFTLATLGESIGYDESRLLALLELLDRLGLAKSAAGAVELTPVGSRYARASDKARRRIFAYQLTDRIDLVKLVQAKVAEKPQREVQLAELAGGLRDQYPSVDIDCGLRQLIDWARYAGLFSYDDRSGVISLQGGRPQKMTA